MRLRRARLEDSDVIATLCRRSIDGLGFLPTMHTPEEDRSFFAGVVRDRETWVCAQDDRITAFLALSGEAIEHLYVDPDQQGRGVGTKLVELAKERRPAGLRLWTFQRNEGARRFYERHGFHPITFTDGSTNEEKEPDVLYEWRPDDGPSPA